MELPAITINALSAVAAAVAVIFFVGEPVKSYNSRSKIITFVAVFVTIFLSNLRRDTFADILTATIFDVLLFWVIQFKFFNYIFTRIYKNRLTEIQKIYPVLAESGFLVFRMINQQFLH